MQKLKPLLFILLLSSGKLLFGQFQTEAWLTGGHNQTRWDGYMNVSIKPAYTKNNIKVSSGFDLSLLNPQNKFLNAWDMESEIVFEIKEEEFSFVNGLWYCPFSEWVHEFNIVLALRHKTTHWDILLGNNSRIYSLTKASRNLGSDTDSSDNNSVKEWRNLMYNFEFLLKPEESRWNATAGITDYAPFFFNQETNPMAYAGIKYKMVNNITLYSKFWYQPAGNFNLQADYFGLFIQGGIIWKAEK
ncbi:MAG: hypothetical protein CVU11_09410 [Bacteroidetes bacterium HGW-Bacteroidetes-6]|jgi:hypothetical protein|nr:MAG: hypothetical protein CVU11_09410 [Bacteroidetes bacterium HGW-Bacteroidetes-6]